MAEVAGHDVVDEAAAAPRDGVQGEEDDDEQLDPRIQVCFIRFNLCFLTKFMAKQRPQTKILEKN